MMDMLSTRMIKVLKNYEVKVATAESCTGGLMAKKLTDFGGSSFYFEGGVVTYSNEMKEKLLGIPMAFIEEHGAVSQEVAQAMAKGVRSLADVNYGVGITGIAGPGGATRKHNVGIVFISVYNGESYKDFKVDLSDDGKIHDREFIREFSARKAIGMLLDFVEEDFGAVLHE